LRSDHSRQPDEFWWSSHRGICRWIGDRFVLSAGTIGVHLDDRAVEGTASILIWMIFANLSQEQRRI
jgi:hypothetical protein